MGGLRKILKNTRQEKVPKRRKQQTELHTGEFWSNIFFVGKKNGRNRPVVNLRYLNQFIPYHHFKMEGLFCLRKLLPEGDCMCKLDMKDAYFSVPLHQSWRNYVRFSWSGVPLLMFRLGISSQNLYKIAEDTDVCTEEDLYSDSSIFGRYANNGSNDGRNSHVQRHCNLPNLYIHI